MRTTVLALCMALAGCASSGASQAYKHYEKGEYWSGITLLQQEVQRGNYRAWNDLGVGYQRVGERDKAIAAYNMAARYGDPTAQQNLIGLGQPVPTPDLANAQASQRAANAANTAATLQLMRALNPPPAPIQPPRPVNCTSVRTGSTVTTNCY